ncbi:MAG: glycosyltransferase family 4 protein [bacterium]|nr:glycosyltransferase family 4 protein [bacterium]
MRVLHLVKTAQGAAWARRQMAVLVQMGIDVVVALPGGTRTPGAVPYRRAGVTVVDADLDWTLEAPWNLPHALATCRALVADVRPDLVHSHFVSTTLTARLALGRRHPLPRLFQVAGPLHLEHLPTRRLDLATAGPRDAWIATCDWTRERYARSGVPASRLFRANYGIDLAPFGAAAGAGAFRRASGVGATTPLVGLVAWMYRPRRWLGQRTGIKGHEDFLAACRRVTRMRPGTVAVVVGAARPGAADYEARLRALAAGCDAIRFVGARDDVAAVYRDLDVAVHPSLSENHGGAVESLASCCPTVATCVGGLPEIVRHGDTGWLVPPRAPDQLASAIQQALADPVEAQRRARVGQTLVRARFDVTRTAAEVAAVYAQVLGEAPSAAAAAAAVG